MVRALLPQEYSNIPNKRGKKNFSISEIGLPSVISCIERFPFILNIPRFFCKFRISNILVSKSIVNVLSINFSCSFHYKTFK